MYTLLGVAHNNSADRFITSRKGNMPRSCYNKVLYALPPPLGRSALTVSAFSTAKVEPVINKEIMK